MRIRVTVLPGSLLVTPAGRRGAGEALDLPEGQARRLAARGVVRVEDRTREGRLGDSPGPQALPPKAAKRRRGKAAEAPEAPGEET